jgi:hypothetical protein
VIIRRSTAVPFIQTDSLWLGARNSPHQSAELSTSEYLTLEFEVRNREIQRPKVAKRPSTEYRKEQEISKVVRFTKGQ